MKQYLTYILIIVSIAIVIIGHIINIYWSGIVAWAIATILLGFAIYFTKYIRNDKQ